MSTPSMTVLSHDDAAELLPWYAARSLDADEQAAVAAHLETCESCRAELAELRLIEEAVAETGAEEPAYRPALLDETLARIDRLERIERDQATVRAGFRMPGPVERLKARVGAFLDSLTWSAVPAYARIAIVGQFVLLAALAAVLLREPAVEPAYTTASGTVQSSDGARFTISFRDDATVAEVAALLAGSGASIVAGPSSIGVYTVVVADRAAAASFVARAQQSPLVAYVAAAAE